MRVLAVTCSFCVCLAVICGSVRAADGGAALYGFRCSHCHGDDGSGNTEARKKMAVPDLRDKKYADMSDEEMFESIGHGKNHKEYPHAFLYTGMDEEQVKQVVVHIRKFQKK